MHSRRVRLADESSRSAIGSFFCPHCFLGEFQGNLLADGARNIEQPLVSGFQLPFQVRAGLQCLVARIADLLQLACQFAN